MMAALFLFLTIALLLAVAGKQKESMWVIGINVILSLLMLWHHMTTHIPIHY